MIIAEVDVRSVSIRTNAQAPMFIVTLAPLAINLQMQRMKVAGTIYNQYQSRESSTIEMILPLDKTHNFDSALCLLDETGNQVRISIQSGPQ